MPNFVEKFGIFIGHRGMMPLPHMVFLWKNLWAILPGRLDCRPGER